MENDDRDVDFQSSLEPDVIINDASVSLIVALPRFLFNIKIVFVFVE